MPEIENISLKFSSEMKQELISLLRQLFDLVKKIY